MTNPNFNRQRVLIASHHPLFGKGLQSLFTESWGNIVEVVGIASNKEETSAALQEFSPDLVVVDYDDENLNREDFISLFLESQKTLRVVLLSLKEGEEGAKAIVYDRRTMVASQVDAWLEGGMSFQKDEKDDPKGENT